MRGGCYLGANEGKGRGKSCLSFGVHIARLCVAQIIHGSNTGSNSGERRMKFFFKARESEIERSTKANKLREQVFVCLCACLF